MKDRAYSIKELESVTGIKSYTIRMWEKRYNLLSPIRSSTNIRMYTAKDLDKIIRISTLYNNNMKISKIAKLLETEIYNLSEEILKKVMIGYVEIKELYKTIEDFDEEKFDALLESYFNKYDKIQVAASVLFPLNKNLSILNSRKRFSTAVEQYFLNKIFKKIISISEEHEVKIDDKKNILILQLEHDTTPINQAIVEMMAKTKGLKTYSYYSKVDDVFLPQLANFLKPKIVYVDFSAAYPDNILKKKITTLKKAFKKSSVYITGRKNAYITSHKLPSKFLFFEEMTDMYKSFDLHPSF